MPPSAQVNQQPQEVKKTPLQLISQGACLSGIPKHPTFALHRQLQLEKMALAFRVFARLGYTDVSAKNPLAVNFGMLKANDMILVDYEGVPIGGNMSRPANAASFLIHSAVHKARPDIVAACHTHSVHGMAWSVFGRPIEMITQDAAYLYGDTQAVTAFDFGGVVVTQEEGDKIGAALGTEGKVLILQNHGLLTTGTTVNEACFLMTLMERACQCQLLAEAAAANGIPKVLISDTSAKYTFENSSDPETLYWEGQPDLEYEAYMCKDQYKL
ncbi:Class II aldolase adducin domain-containing protein [Fusarium denticulatum]|uniref:Class II aldolase adducin domain-containing protein n=1 Tax=Fusarium denticulatum TaxID=48507 RepID=A0A8H5WJY9_9HYPO|nr:Class II aldolase adducin domain-containing protein [Fusarium denticulatum]